MNGFFAALKKDFSLFFRKRGLFSLLFPLLLLPLFLAFFQGGSGQILSFPVSIIDEDETLMSKTLIRQMEEVELFSEVHKISREEISAELEKGSVGILRIPKDFFYTAYRFQGEPVELILNEKRPTEAAILESVFTSVMQIMEKEQETSLAVFHTAYGETLSAKQEEVLYEKASERLLSAVLKRQLIFQDEEIKANLELALLMRIFSALLFLFLSFVSLSVISAVPEEEKKGIVARFRQMRGKGFYLSKFLVLLFLSLVFLALSLLLLHETLSLSSESLLWFSIYYLFSLLSFYFFFWGIFSMIRDERLGKNLSICVIFLILLFSGRLFSAGKIPFSIAQFSPVSITALILEGLRRGYRGKALLSFAYPLFVPACIGVMLLLLGKLFDKKNSLGQKEKKTSLAGSAYLQSRSESLIMRYLPFPLWRGFTLIGRTAGFALFLAFCLLLGKYAEDKQEERLQIYLVNQDQGEWSKELLRDLEEEKSIQITVISGEEKAEKLLYGDKEGVLSILEGYSDDREGKGLLLYESSSSSLSEMAVREIVAALVAGEKIERTAGTYLSSLLGKELSPEEERILKENEVNYKRKTPLYIVEQKNGRSKEELFSPKREAIYAFLLYFFLFSLAAVMGESEEKRVSSRINSIRRGKLRYLGGYFLFFLFISLCFYIALKLSFSLYAMLSVFSYTLFLFGFSRLLSTRFLGEGAETGLSLNLGLFFSLIGGAFMDFSALSGWLQYLPWFSPIGLFLKGTEGDIFAPGILLVFGILCVLP